MSKSKSFLSLEWLLSLAISSWFSFNQEVAAQIIPDNTLGPESSRVRNVSNVRDLIEGGAIRGRNLFHSFTEFNIGEGREAYFDNSAGIENILSRITSDDPSDILGTLGTLDNANLFFLNPNGIIFGPNARLDVAGSFVATTADAVQFDNQGFFSASDPEAPALLTIDPSALIFNQRSPGMIENRSIAFSGFDSLGTPLFGLRVPDGENLLMIGGIIDLSGGQLHASGGQISLLGIADSAIVRLALDGEGLSLVNSANVMQADILLDNRAIISTRGNNGGSIQVEGRNIRLSDGSQILTNTVGEGNGGDLKVIATESIQLLGNANSRFPSGLFAETQSNGNGGDLTISSERLLLQDGGLVSISTFGKGQGGNLTVNVSDSIELIGTLGENIFPSGLFSDARGTGNAGDINIRTRNLRIQEGARISSTTFDTGDGGNLIINASGTVRLTGNVGDNLVNTPGGLPSGLFNNVGDFRIPSSNIVSGNAGNITINTEQLIVEEGARIASITYSEGIGGNLNIDASEIVNLQGTSPFGIPGGLLTQTEDKGNAGNLNINTQNLLIQNGSVISASTAGTGSGGDLILNVSDSIELSNSEGGGFPGGIFTQVEGVVTRLGNNGFLLEQSAGQAGDIGITTGALLVRDGAQVSSAVIESGQGRGGNLTISATDLVEVLGISNDGRISSGLSTETQGSNGGDIRISTRRLLVQDGGRISTEVFRGGGEGGDLVVVAEESIEVRGISIGAPFNIEPVIFASRLSTRTFGDGGNAGNLTIGTRNLILENDGVIAAETYGRGQGGNIFLTANNSVRINGTNSAPLVGVEAIEILPRSSGLFTIGFVQIPRIETLVVQPTSRNAITASSLFDGQNAGNIVIDTPQLLLQNSGRIAAFTSTLGQPGDILIRNAESVRLDNSSISSAVLDAADLDISQVELPQLIAIQTARLQLTNGAEVVTSTRGQGNAGNIEIHSKEEILLDDNSVISATVNDGAIGQGGSIDIQTGSISLTEHAQISSSTDGQGDAGRVMLIADRLNARRGGRILTSTSSSNDAGSINLEISEQVILRGNGTGLFANTASNSTGRGGNISVSTRQLNLQNQAEIAVNSQGPGQSGSLEIAADEVRLNRGSFTAETLSSGGGAIELQILESLRLDNASQISASTQDGQGGQLTVNANRPPVNRVDLTGGSLIGTSAQGSGDAGRLRINTHQLSLAGSAISASTQSGIGGGIVLQGLDSLQANNSQISASTQTGQAGSLRVNATDSVRLSGAAAAMSVDATGNRGQAGDLSITAQRLFVEDNASILASTTSGSGGDINLRGLRALDLSNSGQISASTETGEAGSLTASVSESVHLDDDARLLVRATGENGIAGNLILRTNTLAAEDGAQISVSSSDGRAGNVNIRANHIYLTQGEITASTGLNAEEEGANISLTNLDLLLLQDGSLISAEANADATGGNLTVNAKDGFVVADVFENSDIIATAFRGNGGNINISALRIFGMQEASGTRDELRSNTTNDISASSQFGTDGVIAIEDLGIDPVQAAAELPTNTESPPLSQGCQPGIDGRGRFINIERGGIPSNFSDPLDSDRGWEDVQPIEFEGEDYSNSSDAVNRVVEAEGWQVNEQGQVVLYTDVASHSTLFDCQLQTEG